MAIFRIMQYETSRINDFNSAGGIFSGFKASYQSLAYLAIIHTP